MSSIELTIKENRLVFKIIKKDIDILIDRLQRVFLAINILLCNWTDVIDYKCSFSKMDEDNPSTRQ